MKKKFIPIMVLSTGILFSSVANAEEKYFTDITENYIYYDEIKYLLSHNIIDTSEVEFLPNKQATREEIVVMLAKALNLNGKQRPTDFTDIPQNHPSSGYIQSAVEAGIVNGYSDGTFKPNTLLSRGHMAAFITRSFDLKNAKDINFVDVKPNSTEYEAVRQLAYYGIATGYGDGTFRPNQPVSRQHVAVFLTRALKAIEKINFNDQEEAKDNLNKNKGETTEKKVTEKVDMGDAELADSTGVTFEVDSNSEFEAIVMYKNEQGRKYALSKGKEVNAIESMNIVVVKVSENDFKSLQKNGDILFVERNLIMEVEQESFNMTDFGEELLTQVKSNEYAGWGYGYMNIQEAYKKGITGKGIKIAVADSGVSNHPDLDIVEHVYPNGNKVNLYDSDGHGSHIAGIISAKDNNDGAIGIAPSADIYSIKMEDDAGRISSYQFLLALEWAIDNDMDLLNASITFNLNSPIFQAAINKAYDQGLIVVAATGNDGAENIRYPASYANVIAVGAVTPDDERDSFSNYGDTLDFVAPGKRIAGVSYTGGYITKTGTSMAAPHVVGLLALLMEEFPNKNADWYFKALKDMSVDGDIKGYDKNTGFGAPKYQPSLINKEGGEKEEDSAVVVDDLPMNQQRYYKLIESYLNNIEFATGSYKEHFLNEAEKYMGYIESSPVRDKLLEILHEHGRLQEEKYSTGVKYEEKTVSSVSDLSSKEQRYYNSALGYLDEIAKAKTEREFNRLLGKVENLLSKIQSSPIRDVLLARTHYYGGALNVPYYDGSYYKGQVVGFVPSVPPTDPDIGIPKPEKPTPPADMTGRETDVSQLPKAQQDYYYLAQSHINQATTSAGESHLNKAVNYVLMINNSPIRDVLLKQLHQYGRLLDVPYSTGLYYYGDVNNTPWQPTNPVPNPNPDGGKTEPEKPTTPPTTPPTNPGGGVTSEDRPSIDVPTAKQRYIENLFDSIVKYPEITSYRTRAEEVINELPDSIEKDEYLRRLNEL